MWNAVWKKLRVACALPIIVLLWGALSATLNTGHDTEALTASGAARLAWATRHLDARFEGYGPIDDLGVRAFDVILLSNLAMGLHQTARLDPHREAECVRLLGIVVDRVVRAEVSPTGVPLTRMQLDDHNLFFSHALLSLSLAAAHGDRRHEALALRLARHLVRASSDVSAHAQSYPASPRWPADQSVTLAALYAFDQTHQTQLATQPTARWLRWLRGHSSPDGLPWSTTGALSYARTPRGCALSFITFYTAQFAPEESDHLYAAYVRAQGIDTLGVAGFREWPRRVDGGSDVDAGPVLLGWGTAATGIGLGAARVHHDEARVVGIERLASLVGVPFGDGYLLAPTLGEAMLFAGETATPWFGEAGSAHTATTPEWPILPLLLSALWGLLAWWLLRPQRPGSSVVAADRG